MSEEEHDLEDYDIPHTVGNTVACNVAMICEDGHGNQKPGVGTYYWDAEDPLVIALHFEIFISAILVDENQFGFPGSRPEGFEVSPCCGECEDRIEYDTFGYIHKVDAITNQLLCLPCGREKPDAQAEEALWVFGLSEMEGVLVDADPAPEAIAHARMWRLDQESYQIQLRQNQNVHTLTLDVEALEAMLVAIREFEQNNGGEARLVEGYLESGLHQLEKLANGKRRKKK